MNDKTHRAIAVANKAIMTMKQRGELYHSDEIEDHAHTKIMLILYPNGSGDTFSHTVRYKNISHIIDKLIRYRANIDEEHLLDLANYAFLLAAYDSEQMGE